MKDRVYHIPVMLDQTIAGLNINPDGVYVDVTFGGGGHSNEILKRLTNGRLLAFDQDPDALENSLDDDRFTLIPHNFKHLKNFLRSKGITQIDGLIADLGVSSHQFDEGSRGFSIRFDAALDMRMDKKNPKTAAEIINTYSFEDLAQILRNYGEIQNAGKVSDALIRHRNEKKIQSTGQLVEIIEKIAPRGKERKMCTQVFQAIRIEVNGELEALKSMLEQTADVIKAGGRLVVLSYHSLEDRLVKNWLRSGDFEGKQEKDLFGNIIRPFKPIQNKAIKADKEEIKTNSRANSARLRIAERV